VLFRYAYRSLLVRLRANIFTLLAIALFVAGATLGLGYYTSLRRALVDSSPPENIIVVAKGALHEVDSKLDLDTARRVAVYDGITDSVRELLSRAYLGTGKVGRLEDAVVVRGIDEDSLKVHRVAIVAGAPPAPNSLDVLAGRRALDKYHLAIGREIRLPGGACKVTGVFSADDGPFEDEIWTPRSALELHLGVKDSSSMTLVAAAASRVPAIVDKINDSKDLAAQAAPVAGFRESGAGLSTVAWTVLLLLVLLSIVATVAIASTMNAAVMIRLPELAALAAIGIRRGVLARVVLAETALLAAAGALLGLAIGGAVGTVVGRLAIGSTSATMMPTPLVAAVGFAVGMVAGLIGGALPALQVRRLDILGALR
jgi:hypothetical protein